MKQEFLMEADSSFLFIAEKNILLKEYEMTKPSRLFSFLAIWYNMTVSLNPGKHKRVHQFLMGV